MTSPPRPPSRPSTTRLHVAGPSPYDVVVGNGVGAELPGLVASSAQRVAVIHDETLAHLVEPLVVALEDAKHEVRPLAIPAGEQAKEAATAVRLWESLGEAGLTRSDAVVTVGGGATSDLGGFVAATWLRGVRVVHVPTTLLGMVDAAVGGKTGMNTAAGKNLVGSFHEPAGVLCDLDTLATLPPAELVNGLGEVIKCGFIADPEILRLVETAPQEARDPGSLVLRELIERSIQVKIDVVVGDLRERGGTDGHPGREALNYGHTMAHAIERVEHFRMRHGEAVAAGMVFVAEVARLAGRLDDATAARHATTLALVGLPTSYAGSSFEDLHAAMKVDKKARGNHERFVVLESLARPVILTDPAEQTLRQAHHVMRGDR